MSHHSSAASRVARGALVALIALFALGSSVACAQSCFSDAPGVGDVYKLKRTANDPDESVLWGAVLRRLESVVESCADRAALANPRSCESYLLLSYQRGQEGTAELGAQLAKSRGGASWIDQVIAHEARADALLRSKWPKLMQRCGAKMAAKPSLSPALQRLQYQYASVARLGTTPDGKPRQEVIALGAAFLLIALRWAWALRLRRRKMPRADLSDPVLPEDIAEARVLRLRYGLSASSGRVFDKEVWADHSEHTTTTSHYSGTTGNVHYYTPRTTTTVTTTVNHRFWLIYADGSESALHCWGDAFSASKGQVISLLYADGAMFALFNHETGQYHSYDHYLAKVHRAGGPGFWFILMTAALAGFYTFSAVRGSEFYVEATQYQLGPTIAGVFLVIALVWTGTLSAIVRGIRNRKFRKKLAPKLRAYLREQSQALNSKLPRKA